LDVQLMAKMAKRKSWVYYPHPGRHHGTPGFLTRSLTCRGYEIGKPNNGA
jgi:hypothetical protein